MEGLEAEEDGEDLVNVPELAVGVHGVGETVNVSRNVQLDCGAVHVEFIEGAHGGAEGCSRDRGFMLECTQ